jgi:hypothetical protein
MRSERDSSNLLRFCRLNFLIEETVSNMRFPKCLTALVIVQSVGVMYGEQVAEQISIPIEYTLSREARSSLLITDAQGQIVRELLHAAPRKAGKQRELWDGLDETGTPVAAGNYTVKQLATQGLRAEYVTTLGTNSSPHWETWPGNHGGVYSVTSDADGMYVGGGMGEGPVPLLKQSLDGSQRLWTTPFGLDGWHGFRSMASTGGILYCLLDDGTKLYRFDAATGKLVVPAWNLAKELGTSRLSARGDQLVVINKAGVSWLNHQTGEVLDQAPFTDPSDVKIDRAGRVLLIFQGAVVALTRENKTPTTLISREHFKSPWRLAIDSSSDEILVAENPQPLPENAEPPIVTTGNQIHRFSNAGELIRSYGVPGGRPRDGLYDPAAGFLGIYDLADDGHGGFYVDEPVAAPRRLAHFNREGKLLQEWYGGQQYANYGEPDPLDPTLIWLDSYWGELIQAKVDYEHKTWSVRATYRYGGLADGLFKNHYHGAGSWHPRYHQGKLYLVREGTPCVVRVDEPGRRLVPLVMSELHVLHYWNESAPHVLKTLLSSAEKPQSDKDSYLWMDRNGDGRPQREELNFSTWSDNWWIWSTGEGFNYFTWDNQHVYELPMLGWTNDGVPTFAWQQLKTIADFPPLEMAQNAALHVTRDSQGTLWGAFNTSPRTAYGLGGWSGRVGGNRVFKWDSTGKLQWIVGHHSPTTGAAPGEGRFFWRILGTVHECIVVTDGDHSLVHVWDRDGLWVGRLLENPDLKVAPAVAYELCPENFAGALYQNPQTGEVLFFGGGWNNTSVYRIRGWDQFERQSQTITVAPEQAALITSKVKTAAAREGIAHVRPAPHDLQIDGDLKEWQGFKPLEIKDGDQVAAKVYLGWTPGTIYAAFDVNTDRPWKSAAPEHQAFQGGASVVINLGAWEPDRTEVGPGDVRIVAAPIGDEMKLVQFMPKLPSEHPYGRSAHPPTYKTGNGKITFERVESVADSVKTQLKPDGKGYTVEMRVPAWWIFLNPARGQRLRFDAAVTLSNSQGTRSQIRLPWFSRDPNDMTTEDVYLESVLRPANWGEAVLE